MVSKYRCYSCGSKTYTPVFYGKDKPARRCRRCGVIYIIKNKKVFKPAEIYGLPDETIDADYEH